MIRLIMLAGLLLLFHRVNDSAAQDISPQEEMDFSQEYHGQYEMEESVRLHPFDLNSVTFEQLLTLSWMPPSCARAIIEYRAHKGQFSSCEELLNIQSMTPEFFSKLTSFVTVYNKEEKIAIKARQRFFSQLENKSANEQYLGTPGKLYSNLKIGSKERWNMLLLMEKDSGEKSVDDLYVFSHELTLSSLHTRIVTGCFTVDYSQGLVFGKPAGAQSGSDLFQSSVQKHRGLATYHSTDENNMFCGIGMQTRGDRCNFVSFFSHHRIDAAVKGDTVLSLYQSGYHRTRTEIDKRDALSERVCGSTLSWNFNEFCGIGMAMQFDSYDKSFIKKNRIENGYDFTGCRNVVAGINCHFLFRSFYFFSELAHAWNGGYAHVTGVLYHYRDFKFLCSWSHRDVDYFNFHSAGNSSGGMACNERLLRSGWRWRFHRSAHLSLSMNHVVNIWPKSDLLLPEGKNELHCELVQKFYGLVDFQLHFRSKSTPFPEKRMLNSSFILNGSGVKRRNGIGFRLDCDVKKKVNMKLKSEWILVSDKKEVKCQYDSTGFMMYYELVLCPVQTLKVTSRYTIYQAFANSASVYVFESDLPGVLRIKRLNGLGYRWYIMSGYRNKRGIGIFCKFEQAIHNDYTVKTSKKLSVIVEKAVSMQIDIEL